VLDGAAAAGADTELRSLADPATYPAVRAALGTADAVVFGSPVYRASFAFPLKTFLDELPRGMWGETEEPIRAKATGIVLTGASWHHYLALDDLRGILAGFFAAHVLAPGLYVPNELFDEAKQLNILQGNVEISKGSIVIRADRVEVQQNPQGTQSAVATGWPNRRAYFRQRREGTDEYIEGEAERLEYDGTRDVVRLVNQAVLRRFRGNALADEVAGNTVTYDNTTEVYQVLGGPSSAAPAGRVRGVLTPREGAGSEPPAAAASAPERRP